ncbi:MAG: hypothetical protein H6737_18525 [Alphaproteobacteria bacterium]|nr:hypothetical protein [Alphaproteobacteria bacterium]
MRFLLLALAACTPHGVDPIGVPTPDVPIDTDVAPLPALSVVELQANAVGAGGPWLEILNEGPEPAELDGVELAIDGTRIAALGPYAVEGEGRVVVGTQAALDAGVPVDVVVDGLVLGEAGSRIALSRDGQPVSAIDLTGWALPVGASLGLEPGWPDPVDPAGWCDGRGLGGGGDFGTPGRENDPCACAMELEYALDVSFIGTTSIDFLRNGTFIAGTGTGDYRRWTDGEGQHLSFTYELTGTTYEGTRPFGTGAYADQPILFPAGFPVESGTWSSLGPCR